MYLVDTNVLCEPTKKRPSPTVTTWLAEQPAISVSVISLMEIEYGVERSPEPRRKLLQQWFESVLASSAIQIVAVDEAVARAAGRLRSLTEARGKPRSLEDLVLAATAQVTGAVLATRNAPHFTGLGIAILNPFE